MLYAYDLDGTLAHTREAVYAAYKAVGITPPRDFYYRPFYEWAHGDGEPSEVKRMEKLHEKKNEVYLKIAREIVRPTTIVGLFKDAPGVILTGASEQAAAETLRIIGLSDYKYITGLSLEDKIDRLIAMGPEGIYFDDDMDAVKAIHKETGWTTIFVKS